MIVNLPNDGAISRLKTELAEAQADAAYWKKQYEEKTFDFSGANVAVYDLALGIYAWDSNGQLIGRDSYALGDIVKWDDKLWQIQHFEGDYVYLAVVTCPSSTIFGSNNTYSGSTLASVASSYQLNSMSPAALAQCQNVTVNGVTSKVFVPSKEQLESEWDWPKAGNANRICSNATYWTSSPLSPYNVWITISNGRLSNDIPAASKGFRPAVKIPVSALV